MSKPLAASKKVMKNYLSELLTDKSVVEENNQHALKPQLTNITTGKIKEEHRVAELLKNVSAELSSTETTTPTETYINKVTQADTAVKDILNVRLHTESYLEREIEKKSKAYRQGDFQTLFFNVGGLVIALPLIELGGIHHIEKITPLMGKPEWYKGVMIHREDKINVVDSALWVMPEKCTEKMKEALNYQYIIMLGDSGWALTAENLIDTVVLKQHEVKWLDAPSKRPWLAGLVKERMCALLDVNSLIQLLNDGSGIHQDD